MNVSEVNAVNALLRWVLDKPRPGQQSAPEDEARRAAIMLAGRADRTLSAGLTADAVARRWRSKVTCPVCGRTSWHPEDVRHGYCGACHAHTSPPAHDRTAQGAGGG